MSECPLSSSIVIPTLNRPNLLRTAVSSAFEALPEGGEVVVTDDGDVEATRKVLADFDHSRLLITKNTGMKCVGANRNNGVAAARGDVIFFLDDDDLVYPSYPKAVVEALKDYEDAAWGFSSTVTHKMGATSPDPVAGSIKPSLPASDRPSTEFLTGLGCGFWIKRDLYQSVGGIREDLETNEDTDFCLKLLGLGVLPFYSATPGVSLCRDDPSSLTRRTDAKVRTACFGKILEGNADLVERCPDIEQFLISRYAKHAGRGSDFRSGYQAIVKSGSAISAAKTTGIFLTNLLLGSLKKS